MKTKKYVYLICENNGNKFYKKLSIRALHKLSNSCIEFLTERPKEATIF